MFLTKECDYAIRVVRGLADTRMKPVGDICDNEQVPRPFAYKILKKLVRAGIVTSYRGAGGGYRLIKEPEELTLLEIVSAVDGSLFINECLRPGFVCARSSEGKNCSVHTELRRVQEILMTALSEKTMQELV